MKPKPKVKPRIQYIAPIPVVKPTKKEVEEKNEALYKVTVRTGNRLNAGTSGKVGVFSEHSFLDSCFFPLVHTP